MTGAELKQAGFTDDEIREYLTRKHVELRAAGFHDAEIEAKYGPNPAAPPNPPHFDWTEAFKDYNWEIAETAPPREPPSVEWGEAFANYNWEITDNSRQVHETVEHVRASLYDSFIRPWEAVGYTAAESFNRGVAHFANNLDTIAEYFEQKTGMKRGGLFRAAAQEFDRNADFWKRRADEVGITFLQELLGSAIGGAAPGITEFMLNIPYYGLLGAAQAAKKGDENELGAALVSMAKRGILGRVFHVLGPLKAYLRAPAFGTVFGLQAAYEGGSHRDIAMAFGTGLIYSALSPGGRYGLNEIRQNIKDALRSKEKQIERAKQILEPPPSSDTLYSQPSSGKSIIAESPPSSEIIRDTGEKVKTEKTEAGEQGELLMAPEKGFRRKPEGAGPAEERMGRSEIREFLEEKLLIPIRTGRFRHKALGIFKIRPEVIRSKRANDIEVIAHEVGHAIQKFLWPESATDRGLSSLPFEAFKGELDPLATQPRAGQAVTPEGFAEFIRLYITNEPLAQKKAPNFYKYFDGLLEAHAPEVRAIFLETRRRFDLYMKQPAFQRVLSQISIGEHAKPKTSFDDLYTMAVDDLHPLELIVKAMVGGEKLAAIKDPYKLARLLRGWPGKAEVFLKHKPFRYGDLLDIPGAKSLKEILRPVENELDEFRVYIVSRRALELHARGIDTGILREDAEAIVRDYDARFAKPFEELKEFQEHVLQYLKDAGVLDNASVARMRKLNQDYVPFYRLVEREGRGVGKGLTSRQPIKKIRGSWLDIIDPLESIVKDTFLFINLAEKNAVGRALVELAESREGLGRFVEKVPKPLQRITVQSKEIKAHLTDLLGEIDVRAEDIPEWIFEEMPIYRESPFAPKDTITVWRNGKAELYQVDPEIARVFQALDRESTSMLTKLMSYPASWLRAGATLTPEFIGRNPIRDQFTAFCYSKYGFVPGFDLIRGIFSIGRKDDMYWAWKKAGGDQSMLVSMDRDYIQENLGALLQKYPVVNLVQNPIRILQILSEFSEKGTRIGEFRRGVAKEGYTKAGMLEAAFSSREVTLDFARVGAKTRGVNQIIAFWNAQVQDVDRIVRAFRDNPIGTTARVTAAVTLPSILLAIANHDDPRYKEIPQWQKDLFWIVMTDDRIYRIPKPFTLGILFGSIPERIVHYILDEDPHAFDDVLTTLERGFSPGFVPTAFVPLLENWANKSFFFDRPLVPRGREELLPEYQYSDYTTETAKMLGRLIGKVPLIGQTKAAGPAYIENLITGWSGGLGRYALQIADAGLRAAGMAEEARREMPTPFEKAFVIRYPSAQAESINRFYKNYDKAAAVNKTIRHLIEKEQNPEIAMKLWRDSGMADLDGVYKALQNMRGVIDRVYHNKGMTIDEKRQLVDTIYLQMIQIAQHGNALYDAYKKARKAAQTRPEAPRREAAPARREAPPPPRTRVKEAPAPVF